ncbi:MAG: acetyl/propionyl/methylcrotonyl-CoA carboxylase subunit alpha, partial [Lysobacter sp.]
VYSEADRDALHVRLADEAMCIGPALAKASYLSIENILASARKSGAQAVHPGYGFLSERADFARAVQDAGLIFIGPDPASIEAMGNKSAAKTRMIAANVPCVPGYQGDDQDDDALIAQAKRIGLPVMIKAAQGGGGRGMRLVREETDLPEQIRSARSEADSAFGNAQLLIEQAVLDARHVEIQVFGDRHGNVIHFGERDCSVQRRNQKIVEEAPSPAVDDELRARMGAAAVAAAKAVDYVGAGTVEFMLAADGSFYFLEMNTRLQVEHPVTELVYGVDLVEWQLRIAQGEALPLNQEQVLARRQGWAIEVRLCAEDPRNDFMPQTGPVLRWRPAEGPGMRVDHGVLEGQRVTPFYDSMQAKLIAFDVDRDAARRKLLRMLDETVFLGVASNRDLLAQILADDAFARGEFSTGFIAQRYGGDATALAPDLRHHALAALLLYRSDADVLQADAGFATDLSDWRSAPASGTPMRLRCVGRDLHCVLYPQADDGYEVVVTAEGESARERLTLRRLDAHEIHFERDGILGRASYARDGVRLWLVLDGATECYDDLTYAPAAVDRGGDDGRLLAPMDGKIVAVHAQAGAHARKGETLVVLEAMKMEFQLAAAGDGVVVDVACSVGQQVKARQLLARVEVGGASSAA